MMNKSTQANTGSDQDLIETMLAAGKPRTTPCPDRKEAIYLALQSEIHEQHCRTRRTRMVVITGVAASLLLVATLVFNFNSSVGIQTPNAFAAITRVVGDDIEINGDSVYSNADSAPLVTLEPGDIISTGRNTTLSIAWHAEGSLRIAPDSELTIVSVNRVELTLGDVYYDSKSFDSDERAKIEIATPLGTIQHLGTQFIAGIKNGGVEISVREGEVSFEGDALNFSVQSGQSAYFDSANTLIVNPIQSSGIRWQWAARVAPRIASQDRSPMELIQWVSRETGKTIEFSSDSARLIAEKGHLRGMGELDPDMALSVLSVATELHFDTGEHSIRVLDESDR